MKCLDRNLTKEQVFERIDKCSRGELTPRQEENFEKHILKCKSCYKNLILHQLTLGVVKEYGHEIFKHYRRHLSLPKGRSMNICVVGTGFVGLVTGACFAEFGLNVTCVDNDLQKIGLLRKGFFPIYEPGLAELIKRNLREGRLSFTTAIDKAVDNASVVFIAVGTPLKQDGSVDTILVEQVAESIGMNLKSYKVIAIKSTVPVGTGKKVLSIIEQSSKRKVNFDIASVPGFLREGSAIDDFMWPKRVVIGASSKRAIALLRNLYRSLYSINTPFVITNVETAEMIKYVSSAFLATNISFVREIANICEKVGANSNDVFSAAGLDEFLAKSSNYEDFRFAKNVLTIAKIAEQHGYRFEIIESVIKLNKRIKLQMVQKIEEVLGNLKEKIIAVFGLPFRPDTADLREAPFEEVISILQQKGAKIRAYDPRAMEVAEKPLQEIQYGRDAYSILDGTDALLITADWKQFRHLDLNRLKRLMKTPLLIDLQNISEPEKISKIGFQYLAVGT